MCSCVVFGMLSSVRALILAAPLLAAGALPLAAQTTPMPSRVDAAHDWLSTKLSPNPGQRVEEVRDNLAQQFRRFALIDGVTITAKDYAAAEAINRAQAAAQLASRVLAYDLDGDGRVTVAELELSFSRDARQPLRSGAVQLQPTPEQVRKILDDRIAREMAADLNKDGSLSRDEIFAASAKAAQMQGGGYAIERLPPAFDRNGDGAVSMAEYDAVASVVIAALDTDGNGILSLEEVDAGRMRAQAARQRVNAAQQLEQNRRQMAHIAERCALPKIPDGVRFVVVNNQTAKTLSTVSLRNDDREAGVAFLDIEAGTEPLAILAFSQPSTIWRLTGATERVRMFIVGTTLMGTTEDPPHVGVVGLGKTNVVFPKFADCLRSVNETASGSGNVAGLFGRTPDAAFARGTAISMALPSGASREHAPDLAARMVPAAGPSADLWRDVIHAFPGGVLKLEPSEVVAPVSVNRQNVLSAHAGLAGLVEEGALEAIGSERLRRFGRMTVIGETAVVGSTVSGEYQLPTEFRIVKKMRFPFGLMGSPVRRYVLAKGVPMPEGSPGLAEVISEETGKVLRGPDQPLDQFKFGMPPRF
jgi:hypothetical protein